jgi:hypothetical protein
VVFLELVEDAQGDQAEGLLRLHEGYGFVGAGDVVCEVGADLWRDELLLVGVVGDRGVELVDGCVAEGTIQVEVELDFGEVGDIHGLGL